MMFAHVAVALALSATSAPDLAAYQAGCRGEAVAPAEIEALRGWLRQALARRDGAAIRAGMAAYRCAYAAAPAERPERYAAHAADRPARTPEAAKALGGKIWADYQPRFWWRADAGPTEPLRAPASVVDGGLRLWRLAGEARYLDDARAAGDYLLKAQAEAGTGGFGFPAPPPGPIKAGDRDEVRAAKGFLAGLAREGRAPPIVAGWIVDDLGNGDLNYDTGLAGEALFDLAEATGEARYREGALKAADWVTPRPIVMNFNYNGFAVALLARAYQATGKRAYLDEAVARARLGVLSGQIADGPDAGSWIDPHNRRLVYRLIMLRQLAVLARVLPEGHPFAPELEAGLKLGLQAVERQARAGGGVANTNTAPLVFCELAALARRYPWLDARAKDVEHAHMDFVLTRLEAGEPIAGPAAGACALAYAAG